MYKMSREAKTAAKERKITTETYSNTKTHTIRVCRKLADEDYVISIKMIDLQNHLCHQNLWYVAMKKIKSFCGTKYLTKEEVQKYKRKKGQWINDDKSVYIRQDIASKLIRYINPAMTEADEFRKKLGVENDKSIQIEREIIAIIMKIFWKENKVRQYQILGLPDRVDLCFADHKLVIEIDEDGRPYHENNEKRQKLIKNHSFTFIRINPDHDPDTGFHLDVDIAELYNYSNEFSKISSRFSRKIFERKVCKRIIELHVKFFWGIKMRQIFH